MIIKFFISDTCPKCIPLKKYFDILVIQYAKSNGLTLEDSSIEYYNHSSELDKPRFLYHNIQQIPCVIICNNDAIETDRFMGEDCIDKLKVLI